MMKNRQRQLEEKLKLELEKLGIIDKPKKETKEL